MRRRSATYKTGAEQRFLTYYAALSDGARLATRLTVKSGRTIGAVLLNIGAVLLKIDESHAAIQHAADVVHRLLCGGGITPQACKEARIACDPPELVND